MFTLEFIRTTESIHSAPPGERRHHPTTCTCTDCRATRRPVTLPAFVFGQVFEQQEKGRQQRV